MPSHLKLLSSLPIFWHSNSVDLGETLIKGNFSKLTQWIIAGITYSADCLAYCVMTHLLWPTRSEQYFLLAEDMDLSDELDEFNEAPHVINNYKGVNSHHPLHHHHHLHHHSINTEPPDLTKVITWNVCHHLLRKENPEGFIFCSISYC